MPIRRPRGPKPSLRHLSFLETMASSPEGSPLHHGAHAAFLTLRLLDHWLKLGTVMADAEMPAHRAAREATTSLEGDVEMRAALSSVIDAIEALHEPDAQPLLPRVFALGKLLEQRGSIPQAGDVYATVARYVDAAVHLDLAFDAHMRHGFCLRVAGEFEWADQAYGTAATLAGRARDRVRVIHARAGQAKVEWARGNLPAADAAMQELAEEAEKLDANRVLAMVLHDRSGIARHRGDLQRAVRHAFESFRRTTDEFERERVLMDLAGFLALSGARNSAQDAMRLLELGARSQEVRWNAQIGLMELAAEAGSETTFESYRRQLVDAPLPTVARTSFLMDAGRGLAAFGHFGDARRTLRSALALAESSAQNQRIFEIEHALSAVDAAEREQDLRAVERPAPVAAPDDIAAALQDLLHELAGAH
jgi:hypothetical protein